MAYSKLVITSTSLSQILATLLDNQTLIILDRFIYPGIPPAGMVVQATEQKAEEIQEVRKRYRYTKVVALGGCTALDFGRACAVGGKELIVIPTILSNACLSTNRSVINYGGTYKTKVTSSPRQTIVCLPTIKKRHTGVHNPWTASGFGDLFSALSASIEYAFSGNHKSFKGITTRQVAANVPMCWEALQWAAHLPPQQKLHSYSVLRTLAKYLHESSLDVIRNGHSKLNAGSEHKLYYAIQEQQRYAKAQVTHGILVSIGTLITTKLFQQESGDPTLYNAMRTAHKRLDLPLSYEDLRMLGIERAHIVRSLDKLGTDDTWLYGRFHTSVRNSLMDEVFA